MENSSLQLGSIEQNGENGHDTLELSFGDESFEVLVSLLIFFLEKKISFTLDY